jgi:CO/xanthine dehydrogenase Mo-binding subunit
MPCPKSKNLEGRNPNFLDYKILSEADLNFPIEIDCIETHDKTGPFGAKRVGEPGLDPKAPAIGTAFYHAIRVRVQALPITSAINLAKMKIVFIV